MTDSQRLDLEKIEKVLRSHESEFAQLGLSYLGATVVSSKLAGDSKTFTFVNRVNGVGIQIHLFPGNTISDRGLVAILTRKDGSTLNVNEYLRLHGREDLSRQFTSNTPYPDVTVFAEKNLSDLIRVLSTELKDMLAGIRWESTPTNWNGYR